MFLRQYLKSLHVRVLLPGLVLFLGALWAAVLLNADAERSLLAQLAASQTELQPELLHAFDRKQARLIAIAALATILIGALAAWLLRQRRQLAASEGEAQRAEERLRTLTDALPLRVSFVDAQERYRFNNLAYERVFGRPRDSIYGKTVSEVLGQDAYLEVAPRIRRALRGETVTFESELTTSDSYRCYRATYVPQFEADGATVAGFYAVIEDITTQRLEERRLTQLAQVDSVTGVINRTGFERRLAEAMQRSRASGALIALLYLDLDRFKNVNDTHGHTTGDAVLKAFAERLARILRSTDTIARLGGDEFAIIMEGLSAPERAATVAGKIVAAMKAPLAFEDKVLDVTVSVGIAFYRGGDESAQALIERADTLMYEAKAGGRNTYRVAHDISDARA
jgi:diguanylate cyclase (GGDEF)-like protein/PAS domain S-box-containing protein